MEIGFFEVFISVFSLVLMAVPGYIIAKTKLLPDKAESAVSNIALYVLQTFMVFMCFQREVEYSTELVLNMLIMFVLAVVFQLIIIGIGLLVIRGDKDKKKKKVAHYACAFSNCGFMGLPFLQMLYTDAPNKLSEVMIYGAVILFAFNLLNWTIGVFVITEDKREISLKKIFLNPVVIALLLGLALFFICKGPLLGVFEEGSGEYKFTEKVMSACNYLGNAVTPMSMILVGMKLGKIKLTRLFTDKLAYLTSFIKLVVCGFLSILVVAWLPISYEIKIVLFFLMSMPAAASSSLFAVRYDGDAEFGSIVVLLSTILSIATIPLIYMVFQAVVPVV